MLDMFTRKLKGADNLAIGFFVLAVLYSIVRGTAHTVLAGLAFFLMMAGALPKQMALAFLVGALVILLLQPRLGVEGFEDGKKADAEKAVDDATATATATPETTEEEGDEKKTEESTKKAEVEAEGFSENKVMLPDNATRREPLELGKPYKLPSESDDKGYHLDAGTTFLNAYKALKPDQIAAMTRDTQELLATQKSLVAMLDSFAPLMKDMGKITGFFGNQQ
jgi:hypothetical protein